MKRSISHQLTNHHRGHAASEGLTVSGVAGSGGGSFGSNDMEIHKIRKALTTDGLSEHHVFIEVEPDKWLEVKTPADDITHDAIHNLLAEEQATGRFNMAFADRAFGLILKKWFEYGAVLNN